MNKQSQWLFEVPLVSEIAHSNTFLTLEHDRNAGWEREEEWETVGLLRVPKRAARKQPQTTQTQRHPTIQKASRSQVQRSQAIISLPGSRGSREHIRWVQFALNQILGLNLTTDGIAGPQTRNAVRSFQQQRGLAVDGIVGSKTEAAILTALGTGSTSSSGNNIPSSSYPSSGQTMQRTVYGWGQYRRRVEELPPDQRAVLVEIGETIKTSYQRGRKPVRIVQVYGHADWDTPRNPQREQQMSEERARTTIDWLQSYVGNSVATQIKWGNQGLGATQLKASPTSEANRRQNRRVEIRLDAPTLGANGTTCICQPQRIGCPDCECKISDSCNLKCPSKPVVKRFSFQEMWDLIIRHYYCELPKECKCSPCCESPEELLKIFSPELLIAIFWEETGFRNIPQLPCGPAVGFGQVQGRVCEPHPKDPQKKVCVSGIELACQFCGINPVWTSQEILCEDAKSVKIAGMLLWRLYCLGAKTRNGALLAYAGNNRQNIVNGWLNCEQSLRNIWTEAPKDDFIRALNMATPTRKFLPEEDKCVFPGNEAPTLHYMCNRN
jgi:Putative peptidoglycan binding domain